jgi:hypothetical protein
VFAGLYHLAPEVLDAVKILKPETIIRWHRAGSEPGGAGNQGRAAVDLARQLTEACGWDESPRYLIRDRDVWRCLHPAPPNS